MLWAIYCLDTHVGARTEHLPAHRAYLDTKESVIFFMGPLFNDEGTQIIGSMFLLNVETRDDAQAFLNDDPLHKAGVFASVTMFRVRKGRFHPEVIKGL